MAIELSEMEKNKIMKAFMLANQRTHDSMKDVERIWRRDIYPRFFRMELSKALVEFFPKDSYIISSNTVYPIVHIHAGLDVLINSKKDLDRKICKNEFWEMSGSLPFEDSEMLPSTPSTYQAILVYELEDEELNDTVYLKCLTDVSAPISLSGVCMYGEEVQVIVPDDHFTLLEDENSTKIGFGI